MKPKNSYSDSDMNRVEFLRMLDGRGGEGFWSVLGELDGKCLNRNEVWN